jgi:hypothetical protein
MIPSIWTCGRPNSDSGARRYGPEIPAVQSVRNQNRFSSKADLEILSSFPRKEMNTKVEDNCVAHNLDTEFALFGVQTWEIWHRKGRTLNQENLAGFMETKFASLPRRISCKTRWSTPKGTQGHKYNPLGAPRWLPIDIQSFYRRHSPENRRRKMRERVG